MLEQVAALFQEAWGFFQIEWPGLGITFGDVYLGAFIVAFSFGLLRPLLGIGGSLPNAFSKAERRRSYRDRSEKRKQSVDSRDVYRSGETKKHSDGSSTSYFSS